MHANIYIYTHIYIHIIHTFLYRRPYYNPTYDLWIGSNVGYTPKFWRPSSWGERFLGGMNILMKFSFWPKGHGSKPRNQRWDHLGHGQKVKLRQRVKMFFCEISIWKVSWNIDPYGPYTYRSHDAMLQCFLNATTEAGLLDQQAHRT
jgi:hypothetical protein